MDAYEATKVVFSRIQNLDPENAARIMDLLLKQDHGEDMIRLAFGPDSLVHSVVLKARKDLDVSRQTTKACSSPSSWAAPPVFSRSNSRNGHGSEGSLEFPLLEQGVPTDSFGGSGWGATEPCYPLGLGWKQCLFFARGYCKNGSACRFLHGPPEEATADSGEQQEQHFHEQVILSKSQGLSSTVQLMASAASFIPSSTSSKSLNLLLQHQRENQRAVTASASSMTLTADEQLKYLTRSRMETSEYLGISNPGSRQIYLTFPADSTFREEDVSNYFSIYGHVQDVRIPYQQKRMFGFVTFVYPETVKLILAKGNPHFVCNSRVLVKPYKEKGKIFEKKLQHQQLLMERCDLSGCFPLAGPNCRDPFDLQPLDARMLFNHKELLLRRKLEEQQAALDLQHAIELQRRRFSGLQVHDFKLQGLPSAVSLPDTPVDVFSTRSISSNQEEKVHEGNASDAIDAEVARSKIGADLNGSEQQHSTREVLQEWVNHAAGNDKDPAACGGKSNEYGLCQESFEHILPDSPFSSTCLDNAFTCKIPDVGDTTLCSNGNHILVPSMLAAPSPPDVPPSFKTCFFPITRFSDHRAVGT